MVKQKDKKDKKERIEKIQLRIRVRIRITKKGIQYIKMLRYLDSLPLWKYWLKGGNLKYNQILKKLEKEL